MEGILKEALLELESNPNQLEKLLNAIIHFVILFSIVSVLFLSVSVIYSLCGGNKLKNIDFSETDIKKVLLHISLFSVTFLLLFSIIDCILYIFKSNGIGIKEAGIRERFIYFIVNETVSIFVKLSNFIIVSLIVAVIASFIFFVFLNLKKIKNNIYDSYPVFKFFFISVNIFAFLIYSFFISLAVLVKIIL